MSPPKSLPPPIDRRTVIAWVASAAAVIGAGGVAVFHNVGKHGRHSTPGNTGRLRSYTPVADGYGKDPKLTGGKITWPLVLSDEQLRIVAGLADTILPAAGKAPAPSKIGITDFINEWVSAPYPSQVADRAVLSKGIEWVRSRPQVQRNGGISNLGSSERLKLLKAMASDHSAADAFQLLRRLVIGGYYTTPDGFKDIGYIGNTPLPSFPSASKEIEAILETRLKALGI
jgi:hypothetical protein